MIELEDMPELIDPVMVAAFEGWNDAGDAASAAVAHLDELWGGKVFAALQERLRTCWHDHRTSEAILVDMGLASEAVDAVLDWCADNGGFCDCEVVLNAEGRWLECREPSR